MTSPEKLQTLAVNNSKQEKKTGNVSTFPSLPPLPPPPPPIPSYSPKINFRSDLKPFENTNVSYKKQAGSQKEQKTTSERKKTFEEQSKPKSLLTKQKEVMTPTTSKEKTTKDADYSTSSGAHNCDCCKLPRNDPFPSCVEIKKQINYGRRPPLPARQTCEHITVGNETCERCCRLIRLNKYVLSLHCGWHHPVLYCNVCGVLVEDDQFRIVKGNPQCLECFDRTTNNHGVHYQTQH